MALELHRLTQVRGAIWHLYWTIRDATVTQTSRETMHRLYDDLAAMKTLGQRLMR